MRLSNRRAVMQSQCHCSQGLRVGGYQLSSSEFGGRTTSLNTKAGQNSDAGAMTTPCSKITLASPTCASKERKYILKWL
ncbi:hypothetical protein GN956_G24790 [Arapaima gigas]